MMKKLAFFVAVLVGLNATTVVRKPEEEEQQAIVMKDDNASRKNRTSLIIHHFNKLVVYFYAITKEGRKDIISWERIRQLIKFNKTDDNEFLPEEENTILKTSKTSWVQVDYHFDGNIEWCKSKILLTS